MAKEGAATTAGDRMPFVLQAWVDESITVDGDGGPGSYVLAAAVADPLQCDGVRDKFTALLLRNQARLHWHQEDAPRRTAIASAVADMDMEAIVAVGSPVARKQQERARRCCMERLLHELHQLGVTQVWLESRGERQNKRDLQLVDSARSKHIIPLGFRLDFARPLDEPMLWIPDAVAGAVTAARSGTAEWFDLIERIVTQLAVDVR